MIVYPERLPRPTLRDLSYAQADNVLKTKMASGYTRLRRVSLNPPTVKQAVYRIHKSQAAIFEGFIRHALDDGARSFRDKVHTPLGFREHTVRFITNPLSRRKPISRLYWEYSAEVEIEDFATMTAIETLDAVMYPHTYEEFVQAIDMSTYYTESWK
ncbi:hypothetical protein [Photobacterium atrarenae]|uniref:Uncharacterized protein n=1 Tax=Photobacterium atrarenae TaxID=865757 RepID=A0ABY5GLG2_9GAMM|nr:hypothetical protein [Photobacterium atrarenae]UTV30158.1 hypothetical protein NNL38_16360 [Photobacterium atrarenae]